METNPNLTAIVPRKVRFDWNGQPLHWMRDDAFASHWANAFHYLLTQGARFFCRTFREALPLVHDAHLRADVEAFIKQEAIHGKAHHDAIEGVLKQLGIDGGKFERTNARLFDQWLAKEPGGRKLPSFLERRWLVTRVGIVATIEHFTAALGTFLLEAHSWEQHGADPVIADLYRWHGAEEIEHRTVAFGLYRHLGGGWSQQALLMSVVFPTLMQRMGDGISEMMQQDPCFDRRRLSPLSRRFRSAWRTSTRRGTTPGAGWFSAHALRYLKPGYDPENEASTEQALRYIAGSPGIIGPIVDGRHSTEG